MQSLNYFDVITISKTGTNEIEVTDNSPQPLQGKESISYRVAQLFFEYSGIENCGVEIDIQNNIPPCAGLAGGSADGAGVLVGLNHMFGLNLSLQQLCEIGLKVGADIPFCIVGGTALTQGIGEQITPLRPLNQGYFVVIKPKWGVSTPEAFALFDNTPINQKPNNQAMLAAIQQGSLEHIAENFGNVFQYAFRNKEVTDICNKMVENGALGASMTGSGSAVFGLFEKEEDAKACYHKLAQNYEDGFIACPTPQGARIKINI